MGNYIYILLRNTLAGLNTPVIKLVNDKLPMASFILFRQIIMFICSIFTVDIKEVKQDYNNLTRSEKVRLVVSSTLLGLSVYLIFIAFKYVPINIFSLIEQSFVLIISLIFGIIFLKEKINKKIYLFIFINIIGLSFIVTKGDFTSLGNIPLFGTLLLLTQVTMACTGQTLAIKVIKKTSNKSYMFMNTFIRMIIYIPAPFILGDSLKEILSVMTIGFILLMIYASISVFIVDFLGNKSFKLIGYTKTQLFIPIIPLVATISSMFIFQQWFNIYQYIGMVLIFIGLYKIIKLK